MAEAEDQITDIELELKGITKGSPETAMKYIIRAENAAQRSTFLAKVIEPEK